MAANKVPDLSTAWREIETSFGFLFVIAPRPTPHSPVMHHRNSQRNSPTALWRFGYEYSACMSLLLPRLRYGTNGCDSKGKPEPYVRKHMISSMTSKLPLWSCLKPSGTVYLVQLHVIWPRTYLTFLVTPALRLFVQYCPSCKSPKKHGMHGP